MVESAAIKLLLLYWIIPWFPALGDDSGDISLFDNNEPRSRLVMINGHMYFHAGANKNISFVTNGAGSIWMGNTDIAHLPELADYQSLKEIVTTQKDTVKTLKSRLDSSNRLILTMANISRNIITVTRNISADVKILREWRKDRSVKDVKLRKYLTRIAKGIKALIEALRSDGCNDKPCQAGGTCIPRVAKRFFCLCPPHRTGDLCEEDIDECALYEKDKTCQNNGTCENIDNGFLCHCPSGYHGPLCQFKHSTCRNKGICGRGTCVDSYESDNADEEPGYKCICEPGYKLSGDLKNPTCIDVNECLNNPCHPGVDCINLPGSFQCSGCPKGFHGNGQQCADIDECSLPDYPCSTTPRAQCFNTVGSYHCGPCPPGYRGDGRNCRRFSACAAHPCHPDATCKDEVDNVNAGGFVCHCPEGFFGDGIGMYGCKKGNTTVCRIEGRCLNGGTCKPVTEDSYLCACPEGYFGSRCEKVSECISTPCKNGATCQYDITNGYSCICAPGYYGHDCEDEEDSCGQHFVTREGNVTFPDNFDTSEGKMCDIVIAPEQTNNEALRLTFTAFNGMESIVSGPTDCATSQGNLTLFDGDNDNSNVFAVFCGASSSPKAPLIDAPITMTGSRAMFRYKGTKGRFEIKWELKKRDCGYRTSVPVGTLVVPSHYQNFSCEWFLSAAMNQVVEITIPPSKFGTDQRNCSINQLEIFDGYTAFSSTRVIHFCSSVNETVTVRSTGPFLSVFFTNDVLWTPDNRLPGFTMSYKFVEPDHSCGGTLNNIANTWDFSGEITSPNWGGLYPPDSHCTWLIEGVKESDNTSAIASHSLKLEFLDFDVPSPFMFSLDRASLSHVYRPQITLRGRRPLFRSLIKCTQDYLHIFADGALLHDGCNAHKPPPSLLIPEGRAMVQFKSDAKNQGKGFRMKYSLVCEQRLTGNGTIQTWNYPEGGSKGKCTYVITADATQVIVLKMKTIGLRVATTTACFYSQGISEDNEDYVKFTGGREEDTAFNRKYICAKYPFVEEGEFTVSATRPLTIEYSSSGHKNNKGLLLEYYTVDIGCGGFYSMSSGVISSPNFPNKYLPHMHCVYYLNVPWSKLIRLNFDNFDLEVDQNDDCNYDRVELYDRYVSDSNKGTLLGKFCGSMNPPSVLSTSHTMAVVFASDRSVAGNGFSARFESVDESVDCDRTFTSPSGNIIFDSTKGRYVECTFHIALPHNSKIILNVANLTLPCHKGSLKILNGVSEQAPGFPQLWRDSEICDQHELPTSLRSHGNRLFLKLTLLDPTNVYFNLAYETITQNCGGRVSGVSGSLASPQYPEKDSRPMECQWTVAVAPGNRVKFHLTMVDELKSADDNGFCGVFAANRIDVFDGPESESPMLRRYCRKTYGAEPILSDDHEIVVKYRQQGGITYGALFGFMAQFSTECRNVVHTTHTGTIQSPGFPDAVYTNQFCQWTIMVPRGNRLKLTFLDFTVDQVVPYRKYCDNVLKFGDGEIAEAHVMVDGTINVTNNLTSTCDKIRPLEAKSTNNTVTITYQSKKKEENRFWLTWVTVGCGGDLINPTNITVNARNLDQTSDIFECMYSIKAPVGKKIQLRINEFLIFKPDVGKCVPSDIDYSGIQTFAGLHHHEFAQDELCTATKDGNVVFQSHHNEMFIKMKVMKKHIATSNDFLVMEVKFIDTNPAENDDCSAIIDVPLNGNRTIHSPRFPKEYPKDAHCEWLFKAPQGHHLKYTLKEYRTPNSHPQNIGLRGWTNPTSNTTCKHPLQLIEGSLTIFDGNTTRSNIVDRFCQDLEQPKIFEVAAQESLVTFQGASVSRTYQSGESDKDKRIGFVMEAAPECGGLQLATGQEQQIQFFDLPISTCNITIRKKNPEDSGVYIRLDEFFLKNQISQWHRRTGDYGLDAIEISIDGGEPTSRPLVMAMMMSSYPSTHEEFRGLNEIKISIIKKSSLLAPQILIAYSTEIDTCGAQLDSRFGTVSSPKLIEDTECVWTIKNNPGNLVSISLAGLYLPSSEKCVESYFEVRENNETGKILGRTCGSERPEYKGEALWVKLRYVKPDEEDETTEELLDEEEGGQPVEPFVRFRYSHINGGIQDKPGVIMHPIMPAASTVEYKFMGEPDKGLLIHFDDVRFPTFTPSENVFMAPGLYFMEADVRFFAVVGKMREMLQGGSKYAVNGFAAPSDLYLPYSNAIMYAVGLQDKHVGFKVRWEIVDIKNENETAVTTEPAQKTYDCGEPLSPTWEWKTLKNPTPTGQASGYAHDTHCMWRMSRPLLHGIEVQIVKMDLEDAHGCAYDYLAIVADDTSVLIADEDGLENAHKLCRRESENATFNYNYNRHLNIHFVSDRSRGGSGFEIRYRLSCHSFDYIKKEEGYFTQFLSSPGYPNAALADDCSWAIVLESNRRVRVHINELQLPESTNCVDSYLSVNARSIALLMGGGQNKICGKYENLEAKNYTIPHGRLFIRYEDKDKNSPKGFKVTIEEVMEDCNEILNIDESKPNGTFITPLFPSLLPNSLECEYVIHAPAGHRIQFTVDPVGFRLDAYDNQTCTCETCDFLEFRDGATEKSSLIGRYCDTNAPSTITSTGNFLYFRLRTDSFVQSPGFRAVYKMAECGGSLVLNPSKPTLLQSPNYPNAYPMQSNCEWTIYSPNSHFIEVAVNHLFVQWNLNCTTDRLTVYDGNSSDPYLVPPVCNGGKLEKLDYRTSSSRATVSFIANSTVARNSRSFCKDKKCGFELSLKVSDQGCGGLINDNQGTIVAPGYPGRLLPNVRCQWNLEAGVGFRYLLEFEFTDKTRDGYYHQMYDSATLSQKKNCFFDLFYVNGRYNPSKPGLLNQKHFCDGETTYITQADLSSLVYSDANLRDLADTSANAVEDKYYVPFRVNYTKVPATIDGKGCTYKISTNKTIEFGNYNHTGVNALYYCHALVSRPKEYGTTVLYINGYSDEQSSFAKECSEWSSYIELMSEEDDDIRAVEERLCNVTFMGRRSTRRVYLNTDIHIHVNTFLNMFSSGSGQRFNLTVKFFPCGGIINEQPNAGFITSPNYENGIYLPDQECMWQLRAPEGQVVWANITDIDIEQHVQCDHDSLIAGEGRDNTIIHRYCNPDASAGNISSQIAIADRHRTFRTFSRFLTLTWHSDDSNQFRGFKIEYEFIDEGDGCGFITHAVTGVVHSPQFPRDYPHDEECIWDIQVPVGYHVVLKYTHFDIEASEHCENDFLQISEEHSARANEPLGDYYFLFQDEELKPPQCGIETPKPYESTSNRIRLNFTTNSRINAKGFRAEWSAKCGAVFTLSHYSVVSPHYPTNYPNEEMECMYLIEPTGEHAKSVIVLKLQDFDLSPAKVDFGRYPCESDYVEVVDVMKERVVQSFCGGEENFAEPIAIRGAVGIRFVANRTFMHGKVKQNRGFQFSYAMQRCGGEIQMMTDEEFTMPLSSPGFPLDYPHDLDCVWNISTKMDRVFAIKFLKMDIEQVEGCDLDWVELFEGNEATNETRLGKYCGDSKDMPQSIIRTSGSNMLVRFVSDRSMAKGGFRMVITATLGPKHGCGGKLESKAEWNSLSPPMLGDSYHTNLYCGWTILGPEKTMLEFKLVSMDTEKLLPNPGARGGPTCVDELKIYDGYKAFSPMLVEDLCSETVPSLPAYYHTSHRVAHVLFETDSSGGGKGFELQYRSVAPDCGDWFTAKQESQSLDFEAKPTSEARTEQSVQRCQWVIQSDSQTPIEINFKSIKFPSPDGDCSDAYIEIRDVGSIAKCQHPACAGHEADKRVIRYCGEVPAAPFISNTMAVQITTSAIMKADSHAAFSLNYQLLTACNRTINANEVKSGRITSPNYPNPYNHNSTCTTKIEASQNTQILLVFRQFRVEMGRPVFYSTNTTRSRYSPMRVTYRMTKCDHDMIQIYEKERKNDTKQWCGTGLPKTYFSSGNELSLYLQTDYSVAGEGFDASFYTTKYNPVTRTYNFAPIHDASGALTSIGYPNGYNASTTQKWTIIPPSGQQCTFEIAMLSIAVKTADVDCASMDEYLMIERRGETSGNFVSQRLRGCSHTTPQRFSLEPSAGREVSFIFKSDASTVNDGVGVRVLWACHISTIPAN